MEALIELLNSFEEGVAKGTTRNRTQIVGGLRSIENAAVTLSNRGGLPPGTKSICLRIKQLAGDIRTGIESRELSASEFREIVRTKLGQLSTALKRNIQGKLHASDKEQVRQHEAAPDTAEEINAIIEEYGYSQGVVRGKNEHYAEHLNMMMEKFLYSLTLQELRSMDMEVFASLSPDDWIEGDLHGFGHIKRNLLHKSDDEYKALSESYKHLTKLLPKHVEVAKAISYPVIPLFNDIEALKNPRKLETAGFDVTQVGDHFIVLENQFILCLNTEELGFSKTFKMSRDKASLKSVKGSEADAAHNATHAIIRDFIDQINARSKIKYVLASNTIVRNPLNGKVALIWLIPEHSRHVLEQTLRTRKVDWDIPRHDITDGKV